MKTGTIFVLVAFIVGGLEVACVPRPTFNREAAEGILPENREEMCLYDCLEDSDCGRGRECVDLGCSRICSPHFPAVGICVEECQGSWDCPLGHWCVNTGCGHICAPFRNLDEQRPGICPLLPKGSFETCVEMCRGDEFCPLGQKCCSNGCGHVCTAVRAERYWVPSLEEDAQKSDN
ncbi:uncharacterized protein AAG666_005842 isoform 1-T1 [Megaptera novaeangliae]